jgi:pyrrolysyl-tRNA synthetase-like protein
VPEIGFTVSQRQRLAELGADAKLIERRFGSELEREDEFKKEAKALTRKSISSLEDFLARRRKPLERIIEEELRVAAIGQGFSEVVTPIIISRSFVEGMGITEKDPLWGQIIWIDEKQCLRPMLAPSLYTVMRKLLDFTKPVRIFEIGQCFRLDTKGPLHLEEFTMLNMVELAPDGDDHKGKLLGYVKAIMDAVGLSYEITSECSEVYGETLDVTVKGTEVASAAIGPKPMDAKWGICDPWIGVGFGIERLTMFVGGHNSTSRVGRSLIYLDGSRLSVK